MLKPEPQHLGSRLGSRLARRREYSTSSLCRAHNAQNANMPPTTFQSPARAPVVFKGAGGRDVPPPPLRMPTSPSPLLRPPCGERQKVKLKVCDQQDRPIPANPRRYGAAPRRTILCMLLAKRQSLPPRGYASRSHRRRIRLFEKMPRYACAFVARSSLGALAQRRRTFAFISPLPRQPERLRVFQLNACRPIFDRLFLFDRRIESACRQ